jgi:hypothetical protein
LVTTGFGDNPPPVLRRIWNIPIFLEIEARLHRGRPVDFKVSIMLDALCAVNSQSKVKKVMCALSVRLHVGNYERYLSDFFETTRLECRTLSARNLKMLIINTLHIYIAGQKTGTACPWT